MGKMKDKIINLRTQGLMYRQIQEKLDISSLSVIHHHLKNAPFEKVSRQHLKETVIFLQKENAKLRKKLNKINNLIREAQKDKNIIRT
jgi:hypothetical protein